MALKIKKNSEIYNNNMQTLIRVFKYMFWYLQIFRIEKTQMPKISLKKRKLSKNIQIPKILSKI